MKWGTISLAVIAALAAAWYVMQSDEANMDTESRGAAPLPGNAMVAVGVPASPSEQEELGKRAFDAVCASCHGENAQGKLGTAPPLVHKIYEPGHHADMAFVLAAQNGVRAHHWKFGNMPAVKGVTQADVRNIIAYVRALQLENGIN